MDEWEQIIGNPAITSIDEGAALTNKPRDNWEVKPPRPVKYEGLPYFFVSFDAPRIEIERGSDGRRRINWDGDDCWVTLQEPMTSRTVRVHLQDNELEF